ncbi:MAG TPA: BON domain-containing protein [Burkholderiales bacterium]|nr:BON domain-containing protein [Burkholderiales bacterium]
MNRRLAAAVLIFCASVLTAGCFPLVVGGTAGGAALIADRRPPDIVATDQRIEWTMSREIEKRLGNQVHINVTSYNRQVLLTGEVTTPEGKAVIDDVASRVHDVRKVYNEVQIGLPSSLDSRSRDTYITSQVKTRMLNQQKFNPLHVKVVTEARVVYLMGLVTVEEAEEATEIARSTSGVQRVVRLFEYVQLQPSK